MLLTAQNISKSYNDLPILKNVNISIAEAEIVSIVGASGAGKTTLLQILGTLLHTDKGTITINGQDVTKLNDKALSAFRNQYLGFIFQFHQLLPEFTALENVSMPAWIKGTATKETLSSATELLDMLGLSHRMNHLPSQLSGGEQQRVAVARALINKPKLILADEPSGNLDTKNAEDLHQLFFTIKQKTNTSFVIVTHNEALANLSDRKLVMKDGDFV